MGRSQLTGTPWHLESIRINDNRRHKSRCDKYAEGRCIYYLENCRGSSHCELYRVDPDKITITQEITTPSKSKKSPKDILVKSPHTKQEVSPINKSSKIITFSSKVELYDYVDEKYLIIFFGVKGKVDTPDATTYTISHNSPLALCLMGKAVNADVTVNNYSYKITKIY